MTTYIHRTSAIACLIFFSACVFQAEDHSVLPLADQLLLVGAGDPQALPMAPPAPAAGSSIQLMTTSPADGANNVPVNASIQIVFNKRMAQDCITVNSADNTCSGTLQISSDDFATCVRMKATVMNMANDTVFNATPHASLTSGMAYKLRVRGDVADYADNRMGVDVVAGFTTAAPVTKRTFVTDAVYNGNLGGVAGADAKCMSDANYPGSGTYKALITDGVNRIASASGNAGDGQVDWVLRPNTTYFRANGTTTIMTTDANGLFVFGTLDSSPDTGVSFLATGLESNWTSSGEDCSDWTAVTGNGRTGWGNRKDSNAINALGGLCSFVTKQILCIEQ